MHKTLIIICFLLSSPLRAEEVPLPDGISIITRNVLIEAINNPKISYNDNKRYGYLLAVIDKDCDSINQILNTPTARPKLWKMLAEAQLTYNGLCRKKDYNKSLELTKELISYSEENKYTFSPAYILLGHHYFYGHGVEKDTNKANTLYTLQAIGMVPDLTLHQEIKKRKPSRYPDYALFTIVSYFYFDTFSNRPIATRPELKILNKIFHQYKHDQEAIYKTLRQLWQDESNKKLTIKAINNLSFWNDNHPAFYYSAGILRLSNVLRQKSNPEWDDIISPLGDLSNAFSFGVPEAGDYIFCLLENSPVTRLMLMDLFIYAYLLSGKTFDNNTQYIQSASKLFIRFYKNLSPNLYALRFEDYKSDSIALTEGRKAVNPSDHIKFSPEIIELCPMPQPFLSDNHPIFSSDLNLQK